MQGESSRSSLSPSSSSSPSLKIAKDHPFSHTRQVCRKCAKDEFQQCLQSLSFRGEIDDDKRVGLEREEESHIYSKLFAFKFESTEKELVFPSSLSSKQRKLVHTIAQSLGLEHVSSGLDQNRYISVSRGKAINDKEDENTIIEFYNFKGYIGLSGMVVDAVASGSLQFVPENSSSTYISNQQSRDGLEHHITILSKSEVKFLSDKYRENEASLRDDEIIKRIMDTLEKTVPDDWVNLGVGKVERKESLDSKEEEEAYFNVLSWEAAQKFRTSLGLPPHDFHITLGFKNKDIHDVEKDISTLFAKITL